MKRLLFLFALIGTLCGQVHNSDVTVQGWLKVLLDYTELDSLSLRVIKFDVGTDINEFSVDGTLAGNSDDALPTEKAVKTYVDATATGFPDPMTTRGDIIYRNSSNITARLGLGSNKYVLQSDGTDLAWSEFLASEMNIVDGGGIITATQVEAALQEHRTAINLNTAKNTNVPTTLSVGTVGINTVAITSDGGADDVTLPAAIVTAAGMLTTAKWAEIVANNAKVTMTYPGAGIALSTGSAWSASITDNSANWNTAYTDRLKWDGGSTGLVAGTGRTSLGGTTIGQNIFTSTNPGAITFGRANADNTFSWLSATNFRTAINVDIAGTDNSTDVTLNASATTGGMSISTQEISNRASTNAQTGYATAAQVTAQEAATAHITADGSSHTYIDQDLRTSFSPAWVGLSLSGELDLTGTGALIDLNPSGTGTADIINITPSAALATTAIWNGLNIDGSALDPSGIEAEINGINLDFSGVSEANSPLIHAIRLNVPFGQDAVHIVEGKIHFDTTLPSTIASTFTGLSYNINSSSLAATSSLHVLEVSTTGTPSGELHALHVNPGVIAVFQDVATFSTPSQTEFAGVKHTGGATWVDGIDAYGVIFVADDDAIFVGSATQFSAIEVIMTTGASKSIQPTFSYSTGASTWLPFFPDDETDGFQESGDISWELGSITATWTGNGDPGAGETTAGYWIRIVRTRNGTVGSPDPATVKIALATEYQWDETGDILANNIAGTTYGSNESISDAEFLYINTLSSNAQTQFGGKADTTDNATRTNLAQYFLRSDTTGTDIQTKTDNDALYLADDTAYNATSWDANTDAATKNAIRDKIEGLAGGHDAVTLNASATTGGMGIATQEISNRAATNAQTGYMTAALVGNIETNNAKNTNVSTTLSIGTTTTTTVAITSDGGADDVVIPAAINGTAGLLTDAKWDEIVANTSLLNVTPGTATASKTLVVDASKDITLGTGDLTATNLTGTLQTAAQGNITSLGTLTSLSSGAITSTGKFSTTLITEQMRLNYDATNYAHFTVDAEGRLTITTVDADAAEGDIILAPDGNVGIGTTTPGVKLEIANGSLLLNSGASAYVMIDRGSNTVEGAILFKTAGATKAIIGLDGDSSDKLHFSVGVAFFNKGFTLDTDGNVGIGTASPGTILEIADNNANASRTLFTILNNDEQASGETSQTADIEFEVKGTVDSGSNYTNEEAAKISAYKIGDFWTAGGQADNDAGLKLYTVTDGAYVLNTTFSEDDVSIGGNLTLGGTVDGKDIATLLGATPGTATASVALIVDASKDIDLGTGDLTATNIISNSNYVMEGYSTGRNVHRSIEIKSEGTASGTTCTFEGISTYIFNQSAIASETVTEGGGGTRFSTDATGSDVTIKAITGVIAIKGYSIVFNDTGTAYIINAYYSGGNLLIGIFDINGTRFNWSDIANGKSIDFIISFVTSS